MEKSVSAFGKHRVRANGLRGNCKECEQKNSVAQRKNPDYVAKEKRRCGRVRNQLLEYKKQHYVANKEKYRILGRDRYLANKREIKLRSKAYQRAHPEMMLHAVRMRQAAKINATPPWLTREQKAEIKAFYRRARELTRQTGIQHEVDHIIPLRGREYVDGVLIEARGFHVPWNLQILTSSENSKKSNKFLGAGI